MKRFVRLDERDIRKMIAKEYNVPIENVMITVIKEPQGYQEEMIPVFYVDIELKGE